MGILEPRRPSRICLCIGKRRGALVRWWWWDSLQQGAAAHRRSARQDNEGIHWGEWWGMGGWQRWQHRSVRWGQQGSVDVDLDGIDVSVDRRLGILPTPWIHTGLPGAFSGHCLWHHLVVIVVFVLSLSSSFSLLLSLLLPSPECSSWVSTPKSKSKSLTDASVSEWTFALQHLFGFFFASLPFLVLCWLFFTFFTLFSVLLFCLHLLAAKPKELEGLVEFSVKGPGGAVEEEGPACLLVQFSVEGPGGGVEEEGLKCVGAVSVPAWGNTHLCCLSTANVEKRSMYN